MPEKYPIHIRIRDLRRQHSLTQEELADALGLSRQSVNAMETGRTLPSLPVAMHIATFFSVPLTQVFSFEGDQPAALIKAVVGDEAATMLLPSFDEALDGLMSVLPQQMPLPAANLSLADGEVRVELCLPGYSRDELSIEVGEDFVNVTGEPARPEGGRQQLLREFAPRAFSRSIGLPVLVERDAARAELKNGILAVTVPRLADARPRTARVRID